MQRFRERFLLDLVGCTRLIHQAPLQIRDVVVILVDNAILAPPPIWDFGRCGTGRRLPWEAVSDGWSTPYGAHEPIPDQTDASNLDVDQVLSGEVSLADAITDLVTDSYCDPVDLF